MRKKATDALLSMGIPVNQMGFCYIVDAMELYERHGAPFTNMTLVYIWIAKEHRTNSEFVMKSIGKAISYAFEHGDKSEVVKYFGASQRSNGNHLAVLYQRLKEEE